MGASKKGNSAMSMSPMRTTWSLPCCVSCLFGELARWKHAQNYAMIRTAFQTMHPFGQLIFFFLPGPDGHGHGVRDGAGRARGRIMGHYGRSRPSAFASDAAFSARDRMYNLIINGVNQAAVVRTDGVDWRVGLFAGSHVPGLRKNGPGASGF